MLNERKVVPKLPQGVKVEVDIVTSDDIKIYYTGKFHGFTTRYIINKIIHYSLLNFQRNTKNMYVVLSIYKQIRIHVISRLLQKENNLENGGKAGH